MNRFYPARGARTCKKPASPRCKKPRNNNKITGNKNPNQANKQNPDK